MATEKELDFFASDARREYERGVSAGVQVGVDSERAHLRPLLERCEALTLAQLHLHQRLPRPDAEAVALFGNLLADLRAELGKGKP